MDTITATPDYRTFLLDSDETACREFCTGLADATLAEELERFSAAEIWRVLNTLDLRRRAMIFGRLDLERQVELASSISSESLVELITAMQADERADLYKILPESIQDSVMPFLAKAEREDIRKLSSYEEGTAGAIMTSDYVAFKPDLTVAEALAKIRREWSGKETIYYTYVVDEKRRLLGFVSLRNLILAKPTSVLASIMQTDVMFGRVSDDQEEIAQIIALHNLIALPIINGGDTLVGIVTHDNALDVVTEEATEDILRMAGMEAEEQVDSPFYKSVIFRAPWLSINLITAISASFVVSLFQDTLSHYIVLAAMMPIIAGMGGNAGTQALAITVRGIALGEVSLATGRGLIIKEVAAGCANGILLGLLMGVIAYLWMGNVWLGLIMFLSMAANLMIAGLFGSVIPLTLKALKIDPALGSSIFITTATDVGGFLIFLSLATLMLNKLA